MLTGFYGYFSANTYSPLFYHVIPVFRWLFLLSFFLFLIAGFPWHRHSLSYFILERSVFRCGVLSEHDFG